MSVEPERPYRIVVLASGTGTNLQAILDAIEDRHLDTTLVACVLSDQPDAGALERARRHGIPACALPRQPGAGSRDAHEAAIEASITEHSPVDLLVLAGYMRILSPTFIARWPDQIINTHPSLLPAFPGRDGPTEALAGGVRIAGCTTHFVDTGVDTGPIILQAAVRVHPDDDRDRLHARIQRAEHLLLPRTIGLFAEGRIMVKHGRVTIAPGSRWSERDDHKDDPEVMLPVDY